MHALHRKEKLALVFLSRPKSSKLNETRYKDQFPLLSRKFFALMKGRYILFCKRAFSSVLEGVNSKTFLEASPRPASSLCANPDGRMTDFHLTEGASFHLPFPKVSAWSFTLNALGISHSPRRTHLTQDVLSPMHNGTRKGEVGGASVFLILSSKKSTKKG